MRNYILLLLLITDSAVSAQAQDHDLSAHRTQTGLGFYERNAERWFWYAQEPKEPEEGESEPQVPQPESLSQLSKPEKAAPTPRGPAVFSAAWFRENL